MRKLSIISLIVFLMVGIAYGKDYEVTKKAGEYNVLVKIDKNPPIVGNNNVIIEVTDAAGHHAKDAKVVVEYSMPAMPGMPPMDYKTNAELKDYEYKAKINLSVAGSWSISIRITRAGKTSTAKFTVDAK